MKPIIRHFINLKRFTTLVGQAYIRYWNAFRFRLRRNLNCFTLSIILKPIQLNWLMLKTVDNLGHLSCLLQTGSSAIDKLQNRFVIRVPEHPLIHDMHTAWFAWGSRLFFTQLHSGVIENFDTKHPGTGIRAGWRLIYSPNWRSHTDRVRRSANAPLVIYILNWDQFMLWLMKSLWHGGFPCFYRWGSRLLCCRNNFDGLNSTWRPSRSRTGLKAAGVLLSMRRKCRLSAAISVRHGICRQADPVHIAPHNAGPFIDRKPALSTNLRHPLHGRYADHLWHAYLREHIFPQRHSFGSVVAVNLSIHRFFCAVQAGSLPWPTATHRRRSTTGVVAVLRLTHEAGS